MAQDTRPNPELGLARLGVAITPHDTTEIDHTAGVYIGGSGNLVVNFSGDLTTDVTLAVVGGAVLPLQVSRIKSTGTTATGIVALYH